MACAISSLPVPDSPRSSTVVLVGATCEICSIHLLHRAARADEVREAVALLQLRAQVRVLVDEHLVVGLDQPVHPHGLRDHRPDDAEELRRALVVAVRLERQVDAEGADGLAVDADRHADVGQFLVRQFGPGGRAEQEPRLAADLRDHHRVARPNHFAGDALADAVPDRLARLDRPGRGLDGDLARLRVEQHDRAADGCVVSPDDFEDLRQPGPELVRRQQRLADFQQRRQLAHLRGVQVRPLGRLESHRHDGCHQ